LKCFETISLKVFNSQAAGVYLQTYTQMKTYFKLLAFAKPYSRFVPKYAVLALLAVFFGLANFTLLIPLLNVILCKLIL
jgi:hypothetical protein